jgi:hypothetical protein
MSTKIENVKLSTITGYAFDGGNRRGFPWKSLADKWVLFQEEIRQPPPADSEEAADFEPDKRNVLTKLVFGKKATEETMKKFCNLFRNHEQETWGIAQSICDHDVIHPIELTRTEDGNKIVAGAHRFVGALIRYCLAVLAKNPEAIETIKAVYANGNADNLIDRSNVENIHRRELPKSALARQAYEYHLRDLSDQTIAEKLSLPSGRQKITQYRKVYEWCIENGKEHLLDKWDAGEVTLDGLLSLTKGSGKGKNGRLERKKTRTRTMPYAHAYDIYNSVPKLESLMEEKTFKNPIEAVRFGMRIVMGQSHLETPEPATGKPAKKKKGDKGDEEQQSGDSNVA